MKNDHKITSRRTLATALGRVETYDRSLELDAAKLAGNKGSSLKDRAKFAEAVITTSKNLADSAIARRLRKPQKAIA